MFISHLPKVTEKKDIKFKTKSTNRTPTLFYIDEEILSMSFFKLSIITETYKRNLKIKTENMTILESFNVLFLDMDRVQAKKKKNEGGKKQ